MAKARVSRCAPAGARGPTACGSGSGPCPRAGRGRREGGGAGQCREGRPARSGACQRHWVVCVGVGVPGRGRPRVVMGAGAARAPPCRWRKEVAVHQHQAPLAAYCHPARVQLACRAGAALCRQHPASFRLRCGTAPRVGMPYRLYRRSDPVLFDPPNVGMHKQPHIVLDSKILMRELRLAQVRSTARSVPPVLPVLQHEDEPRVPGPCLCLNGKPSHMHKLGLHDHGKCTPPPPPPNVVLAGHAHGGVVA